MTSLAETTAIFDILRQLMICHWTPDSDIRFFTSIENLKYGRFLTEVTSHVDIKDGGLYIVYPPQNLGVSGRGS